LNELKDKTYALLETAVLIFFMVLFGTTGWFVVLGMFLLFFLPAYLVIKNLDLTQIEKIFYSFFIGWGLFPTLVYYIAILFSSIRIAIAVSFVLLMGVAAYFNRDWLKNLVGERRKGKRIEEKND